MDKKDLGQRCDKCHDWKPSEGGEYFSIPRRGDYWYCAECSKPKSK